VASRSGILGDSQALRPGLNVIPHLRLLKKGRDLAPTMGGIDDALGDACAGLRL